jgi:hypothetical protein
MMDESNKIQSVMQGQWAEIASRERIDFRVDHSFEKVIAPVVHGNRPFIVFVRRL